MVQDYYTLLTPAGLEAVTFAIATETVVDFASIAVGDANGTTYFPTGQERTLKNEVWRGPITNYAVKPENPNWLELEASIPGNIGGFLIKEAGIFDSKNVLLAIAKPPEAYKPQLNQGAAMDLKIKMTLEVTNADRVIINIDPSIVYATKEYVDEKDDTHANIKATTTQYGHTKLLNSVTSTSNGLAATPNAVKTAYDKAVAVETNTTNHAKDTVLHTYYGAAGGSANAKTVTLSPAPVGLVDGMAVVFKNTTANTGAVTLNVNSLGAKPVVKANGKALTAGNLAVNGIYTIRYNATTGNFLLQGEGSEIDPNKLIIIEELFKSPSAIINSMAVEPNSDFLWIAWSDGKLCKYNLITSSLVTTINVAVDLMVFDNEHLYVGTSGSPAIYKVDLTSHTSTLFVSYSSIRALHVDASYVYFANTSGSFYKFNKTTKTLVATISEIPCSYAIFEAEFAYVFAGNIGTITKINLSTMTIIGTSAAISTGYNSFAHHRITVDNNFLYLLPAVTSSAHAIYKVNKSTLALTATMTLEKISEGIIFDGDRLYSLSTTQVTLNSSYYYWTNRLLIINTTSMTVAVESSEATRGLKIKLAVKGNNLYAGTYSLVKLQAT